MPTHNSTSMPYLRQASFVVGARTSPKKQPDRPQSTPRPYVQQPHNYSSPYSVLASTHNFDTATDQNQHPEKHRDRSSPNLTFVDRPRHSPPSTSPLPLPTEKVRDHSSPNLLLTRRLHPPSTADQDESVAELPKRSLSVQQGMNIHSRYLNDNPNNRPSVTETIRRPILYYAKFGSNWSLDVFSLPHNAVRAECVDLYNILESIHARGHRVSALELEEFNQWWRVFEIFIIEYFDFEADILFPTVFSHSVTAGVEDKVLREKVNQDLLLRSSLLQRKDVLLDYVRQLNGTFELRRHVDISDVFQTVLDQVNLLVPNLLEYFHTEERHMSPILLRLRPQLSREGITKKYLHYIRRGENPQMNLVLLSKWMQPESREKWIRVNVRGYSRLMHKRWERRCDRAHGNIALKFKRRLLRSVKSVAASRLRRRTEFGEEIDDLSMGSFPSQGGSMRSLSLATRAASTPRNRRNHVVRGRSKTGK